MKREPAHWAIKDLRGLFPSIEFPQYQREPNIWSRKEKQRLIDSILREFDIASLYFYERQDLVWECIDGRQRLNAIMSFLGDNLEDHDDNGFPLRIESEISSVASEYDAIAGLTYKEITLLSPDDARASKLINTLLDYTVSVTVLSQSSSAEQFNLQFLRLNLGTIVNAGEKLHAMVGTMRDLIFDSGSLGLHPFFDALAIPTRRYAKEQVAAQVALQVFAFGADGKFTRGRYLDLQKFLKDNADIAVSDSRIVRLTTELGILDNECRAKDLVLSNRAIVVSVVLLGWTQGLATSPGRVVALVEYLGAFIEKLEWQVQNLRKFEPDREYDYLIDFQRHVTQASVERYAISARHEILYEGFEFWKQNGQLKTVGLA